MVIQTLSQQIQPALSPARRAYSRLAASKRAHAALMALSFASTFAITEATYAQETPPLAETPKAPDPTAAPAAPSAETPIEKPAPAPAPRAHHAPVAVAKPNEPLAIEVLIEHPEQVRSAVVVYKPANGPTRAVALQRSTSVGYVATIPGDALAAPALGYTIEIERVDGTRAAVFASRAEMHVVQVLEERMDARERTTLERLGNRRNVVTAGGEYANFGETSGTGICPAGMPSCDQSQLVIPKTNEEFWRVELSYTYRPLRTVAEFSLRGGVVRGQSLVGGTLDESKYKVGLNYGAPSVRFRLADAWHTDLELLISITEQGFAFGGGSSLIVGDPYGSNLRVGFETIGFDSTSYFGSRFFLRMDLASSERITVSPIIEVTDMPHSEHFGVRLLCEATIPIGGGFSISARAGYQAREASSGGANLGGKLAFAF